jgi:hypothetical protein
MTTDKRRLRRFGTRDRFLHHGYALMELSKRLLIAAARFLIAAVFSGGMVAQSIGGGSGVANSDGAAGATYFLSPTGNDSNPGTAASPWLSPNHAVNCGDTIVRVAGTYSGANFQNWGTVSSCPSSDGIYFAQVKCAGPYVDSCAVADTTTNGAVIIINQSNWAFVGGLVSSTTATCYAGQTDSKVLHHIAFINVVANGCYGSGIADYNDDYQAIVGAIIYNSTRSPAECYSGVNFFEPTNFDTAPGTHIFVAGVFSVGNFNPDPCAGGLPTDGEGFVFDTFSGSPNGAFTGLTVIEQSMGLGNGGRCIDVFNENTADILVLKNTCYGNLLASPMAVDNPAGEIYFHKLIGSVLVQSRFNIAQETVANSGYYGCAVYDVYAATEVYGNYCFGVSDQDKAAGMSTGFSFGTNTLADPQFVNPVVPAGVPAACATAALTTTCMATTIANFTAQAAGAVGLGYQPPGPCAPDAYFPTWLKGVIPDGLITKPCGM